MGKIKNIKIILLLIIVFVLELFSAKSFAQNVQNKGTYAYITVTKKLLSKKLKVTVDLGDTPEQIKKAEEFTEKLNFNKGSVAAVLNYMAEQNFELRETITLTETFQGTGSTTGIIFIMQKKK